MSTEVELSKDSSSIATQMSSVPKFGKCIRVEDPQLQKQRKNLLQSVFGKTSKSPFSWGLAASNEKCSASKLIQLIHRQFWNSKSESESTAASLIEMSGDLETETELLAIIALCAYRPDIAVEMHDPLLQPTLPPSLFHQLQIELQLWTKLNTEQVFNGTPLAEQFERISNDLLDGDGWPEARIFHEFGLLAASWLRCTAVFQHLEITIDESAESRLDWMCRQLMRSMRKDRSLLFDNQNSGVNCRSFAKGLAKLSQDDSIRHLFLRQVAEPKLKNKKVRDLPNPSSVSEWAQSGVMRSDWKLGSPLIGILFGNGKIDLELAHKFSVIAGNCTPSIWINGQLLEPSNEISVICDLQFDEVDLIELEVDYEDWKLQRQLLMLRDGLVMIADNVLGSEPANIEYRCEFPLAEGTHALEESSTTEIYIRKGENHTLVLPLALPEWQAERTEDRFLAQEGRLILTQLTQGQSLSAPLVFDMKPKRSIQPRTWRQLTVAENLEIVNNDIAVAFRLQIGREQWLFYRSLAHTGNRTFLGENIADEFFVGRMDLKGNIESLAEVK